MQPAHRGLTRAALLGAGLMAAGGAMANEQAKPAPLVIQEQGSFAVGGTMTQSGHLRCVQAGPAAGQTFTAITPTRSTKSR